MAESQCPHCDRSFTVEETRSHTSQTIDGELTDELVTCPDCNGVLPMASMRSLSFELRADGRSAPSPATFAHFQLIRKLGQGGFGIVWLAHDQQLDREVALKLPSGRRPDIGNLMREARTAAKLDHPNIVSVHQVGEHDGQVYIVCEYVRGMDMRSYLSRGNPTIAEGLGLLRGIASGLHHAHQHDVVHRDMKPANVLVKTDGTPLVTDFGLAKRVDTDESISSRGQIIGTIMYMSPEQAAGDSGQVDRRADIYSLGVMMYEVLTGERPYRGDAQAVLHSKIELDPTPLRRLVPTIPLDLETICLKCLQRSPTRRYETAQAFIDELNRFEGGSPIQARPISRLEVGWRWCGRNRLVASLAVGFVLSLLVGLASTTTFWLEAKRQAVRVQRSLYASRLTLASRYLANGDLSSARTELDKFRDPETRDLRGFEWHYLNHQLDRYRASATHGRSIEDVAISREGDWFVSVANERDLKLWDYRSGRLIRSIAPKVGRWQCVSVSRRDNRVAAGAKDGNVYLWDSIADAEALPRSVRHGRSVQTVAYSGNGKRLFTASSTGAIRVWDNADLTLVSEIPTGIEGMACLAVSHQGDLLVCAGKGGTVRLWEVETRSKMGEWELDRRLDAVSISRDATRFAIVGYDGTLVVVDIPTRRLRLDRRVVASWCSGIEFLGASSIVAICKTAGETVLFDTEHHARLQTLATHHGVNGKLAVSSNGKLAVVGSQTGTLSCVALSDYQDVRSFSFEFPARQVGLLNSRVALAAYEDGTVQRLDFEDRSRHTVVTPSGRGEVVLKVSDVASLAAVRHSNGPIEILDARGQNLARIPADASSRVSMAWSVDGTQLAVCNGMQSLVIHRVDAFADEVVQRQAASTIPRVGERDADKIVRAMVFSPDGRQIAIATSDHEIHIWSAIADRWDLSRVELGMMPVSLVWTNESFAIGLREGDVLVHDPTTWQLQWRQKVQVGHLNAIAWVPGSHAFAVVGRSSALQLWDQFSGEMRFRSARHEHQVFSVDVAADGKTILTGGLDGTVQLWVGDGGG